MKLVSRQDAVIRNTGATSLVLLGLLSLATVCPLYNVSGTESAEAAVGTSQDSTITFTAARTTASASLGIISNSGSFATSSEEQKASFSIATNNYTGYELKIKSSADDALTNSSVANNPAIISPISDTEGITSDEFANNTWGFLPSYYNNTENSEDKYYPITTSDVTLRKTSSANTNDVPDIYTIGLGIKADYDAPAGTYTNDSLVLTYVANPVTYAITYDKGNTTDEVANLPTFYNDPADHTQSGEVSASSIILSSTVPERTGYDFTGWCLGAISTDPTTKVDSCVNDTTNNITAKTFQPGGAFGIDQTTTNVATIHAMWTGKATVTLSRNTGASAIVIDGTSYTGSSVSLTYGTHTISGGYDSGYEFSSWAVSSGVAFASGTSSSTETGSITITGNGTLTLNAKQSCTSTISGTMQDFDPSTLCSNVTSGTLTDSRDSRPYTVQKLNDGKWWMMQNLQLGSTTLSTDLTSSNTNLTTTVTASTFNGWKKTTSSQSYTSAEFINQTGSDSYGSPYGTLYNYCAASAGTICSNSNISNATADICPKGWRLPTGDSSGEFQALATAYSISNNATGSTTLQQTLKFPLAGYFYDAAPRGQGSNGRYWSSTYGGSTGMYGLNFGTSSVSPQVNYDRIHGRSVRCVLDTPTISDITYMQDVTSKIINNTAEGATATLTDSRDSKTYTVKKINGQLWMTQNLRFTNTSVPAATSNVTSSKTLTYYSLDKSDSSYASRCAFDSTGGSVSGFTYACIKDSGSTTTGVWYNYAAATARTIEGTSSSTEATQDICPKGWHLPTGPAATSDTDFNKLMSGGASGRTAFGAVSGGFYYSGSKVGGTTKGYWWSTASSSTSQRYVLGYDSSEETFGSSALPRAYGLFIRCVSS